MTERRDVILVVSDLHSDGTTALCPERITLDDGNVVMPNKAQRWLRQCWRDLHEFVTGLETAGDGKHWLIVNGETSDGDHHNTGQIHSRNPADMIKTAVDLLEPLAEWADHRFFTRGTEVHSGGAGYLDELVARDLGGEMDQERNTYSWWHLLANIGGLILDVAHHPPSGSSRPWTKGNPANTLAAVTTMEYAQRRERVPDIVIRGHIHKYGDSGSNYPCRAIITPAWQLATAYSHRRFAGQLSDIGGVILIIEDGVATVIPHLFPIKRRMPWRE